MVRTLLSFVFFVTTLLPLQLRAETIPRADVLPEQGKVAVQEFQFLTDTSHKLGFAEITKLETWQSHKQENFNFGFSSDSYWLRFAFTNKSDSPRTMFLELGYPLHDYLDLYVINQANQVSEQFSGDRRPFALRALDQRNSSFKLSFLPQETLTVYLKTTTESSVQGPLTLWDAQALVSHIAREQSFFSLYVGIMFAMVIYNLFLYLTLRDKSHLYYVLYIGFYAYSSIAVFGWAFQFISPESPALSNFLTPFTIGVAGIFVFLFTREFFQLRTSSPRMDLVCKLFTLWAAASALTSFFSYSMSIKLGAIFSIFASLMVLVFGLICWINGYRPARFFVLAFGALCLGVCLANLRAIGIVEPNAFTIYSQHIGSALEVVLLSIALGDKLKIEQNQAQNEIKKLNISLTEQNLKVLTMNEQLEAKVEEKTRDIRSILAHIRLGVFTISSDGRIHGDYSSHLERLLNHKNLEGALLSDVLFRNSSANEEAISLANSALASALDEPAYAFDMNEACLLRDLQKFQSDGSHKRFEIDWNPVINKDQITEKILVTIRDVTRLYELQNVAEAKKKELEFIGEIVPISRENFGRFLDSSRRFLHENDSLLTQSQTIHSETIKIIYINLHTMKGIARSLGLKNMASTLHEAESFASAIHKNQGVANYEKMFAAHQNVKSVFEYYAYINDQVLDRKNDRQNLEIDITMVEALLGELHQLNQLQLSDTARAIFGRLDQLLSRSLYQDAKLVFDDILSGTERLARDLDKPNPLIKIKCQGFGFTREASELLRNCFSHLLRNAMDHGIEPASERRSKHKPEQGTLYLDVDDHRGGLHISFRDDGRGLALRMIREIAHVKGLIDPFQTLTDERLSQFIYHPGFTTSHSVNEISGRGVGMSAVKSYVEAVGGQLLLDLLPLNPENDQHFRNFQIKIILPPRLYRKNMGTHQLLDFSKAS